MTDGDRLQDLITRLETIRAHLGSRVFRDAVRRAVQGAAFAALVEAERKSSVGVKKGTTGSLIIFPLNRRFSRKEK